MNTKESKKEDSAEDGIKGNPAGESAFKES